ncbi:MAG: hypothetical protein PUJ95_07355 [Bacteroidales bacterium]|nr:hypothetical protein [Bacteroidales bacterium]
MRKTSGSATMWLRGWIETPLPRGCETYGLFAPGYQDGGTLCHSLPLRGLLDATLAPTGNAVPLFASTRLACASRLFPPHTTNEYR